MKKNNFPPETCKECLYFSYIENDNDIVDNYIKCILLNKELCSDIDNFECSFFVSIDDARKFFTNYAVIRGVNNG